MAQRLHHFAQLAFCVRWRTVSDKADDSGQFDSPRVIPASTGICVGTSNCAGRAALPLRLLAGGRSVYGVAPSRTRPCPTSSLERNTVVYRLVEIRFVP